MTARHCWETLAVRVRSRDSEQSSITLTIIYGFIFKKRLIYGRVKNVLQQTYIS